MSDLFEYEPLSFGEFRLLQVLPRDEPDGLVRCRLLHLPGPDPQGGKQENAEFQDKADVEYRALSYTWGDPDDTELILLNDAYFPIRRNLHTFLAQWNFVERPSSQYVWIDALCIDQSNLQERSAQVLRMRSIYEKAIEVYIWLGPEADDSSLALCALACLANQGAQIEQTIAIDPTIDAAPTMPALFEGVTALGEQYAFYRCLLFSLRAIEERAWWKRVWVVQEASVPNQKYTMFCGHVWLDWDVFRKGKTLLRKMVFSTPSLAKLRNAAYWRGQEPDYYHEFVRSLRANRFDPVNNNLRFAAIGREFCATDPRDHVYALLSLHDEQNNTLLPDYGMPLPRVFENFTWYLIRSSPFGRNLDVLAQAESCIPRDDEIMITQFETMRRVMLKLVQDELTLGDVITIHEILLENFLEPLAHVSMEFPWRWEFLRNGLGEALANMLRISCTKRHLLRHFIQQARCDPDFITQVQGNWLGASVTDDYRMDAEMSLLLASAETVEGVPLSTLARSITNTLARLNVISSTTDETTLCERPRST